MLLAREFGWTLAEMRGLKYSELRAILHELQKQRAADAYQEMRSKWAFLAAVITNGLMAVAGMFGKRKQKPVKPDDFLSDEAKQIFRRLQGNEKTPNWSKHIEDARAKGIW